ncbi:MAG: ribonuclease PH [Alphaproteobacteria bacterium]
MASNGTKSGRGKSKAGAGKTPGRARAVASARRFDGRKPDEPRALRIEPGWLEHAEGSALVTCGSTRVLCAVSIEDRVPDFLRGSGRGWLTAEYAMLPRSTHTRSDRESAKGKIGGRTHEIQRLVGRSLRAVVDLSALGERTLFVDCDVLQADGGTRTTAINGAWVAVAQALDKLVADGVLERSPLREPVAAISVGLVDGERLVDLAYREDSRAEVDANFVMTGSGGLVEVQGTAEGRTFGRRDLDRMLDAAWKAISGIQRLQKAALAVGSVARVASGEAKRARAAGRAGTRSPRRRA